MANLGQLTLDLIARVGGFTGPLDQAARQSKKTADDISKNFGKLKGAFMNIFPAAAAAASVAGITAFVKSTVDAADHMEKLSQSAGVSVETLSTMGYAAKFSGIDIEKLADGYKKLSMSMYDAASGTGASAKAFKDLGVDIKESDKKMKSSEKVMRELADAFAGMEDGELKVALANKILGKSGADLIPMLNEGANGLAKFEQKARDTGNELSTKAAKAAAEFNDNLYDLAMNLKGSVLPAINWFVAGVNRVYDAFTDNASEEKLYSARKLLEFQREELEKLKNIDPNKFPWWAGRYERDKITRERIEALAEATKKVEEQQKKVAQLEADLNAPPKPKKGGSAGDGDDAAEKAKRLTAAIDDQIAALVMQANTFGMTEEAAALYKFTLQEGVTPAQIEAYREALNLVAAHKKVDKAARETAEAEAKLAEAGKRIFEETRTPVENLVASMAELEEYFAKGAIDIETYTRATEGLEKKFAEGTKKTAEENKTTLDELKVAIEGWGRSSADAFADFAMSGKASFSDLANSIIQDIIRMTAYQQVFKPMFNGISDGVYNLFGGAPTPGSPNFIGPVKPSAHGNLFEGGNIIPFAKGGVISRPTTFPLGLAGEAGPEAILPLSRIGADLGVKADLGGMGAPRDMKVEIINKSGQQMQVTDAQFNFQDAVITVWIDAYERNKGGLRSRMGG